jgi:hypothetical protein
MQLTFGDAEGLGQRRQTRREPFLAEMDHAMPWNRLLTLIEPHYPPIGRRGRHQSSIVQAKEGAVIMIQDVWSEEVDAILCVGQSLGPLGVRNWAIDQTGTLNVLERLRTLGIAVAGVDVYRWSSDGLESTYDDWYCNREVDESEAAYLVRSIEFARRYIMDYPNTGGDVLFALVPVVR